MPEKPYSSHRAALSCQRAQDRFGDEIAGDLSLAESQDLGEHLRVCPNCHAAFAQWREAETALQSARHRLPDPGDLRAGFYAKLAQAERTAVQKRRSAWQIAIPALSCALLGLWFWKPAPSAPVDATQYAQNESAKTQTDTLKTDAQETHAEIATADAPATNLSLKRELALSVDKRKNASEERGLTRLRSKSEVKIASAETDARMKTAQPFFYRNAPTDTKNTAMLARFGSLSENAPEGVDLELSDTERGFESRVKIGAEQTRIATAGGVSLAIVIEDPMGAEEPAAAAADANE